MTATPGHIDFVEGEVELTATVPSGGVDSVQVQTLGGQVVASRTRPAVAPSVAVQLPRTGGTVGGARPVLIRWRSTNPQHLAPLALTATIDYSADGGRSWRVIYIGPDDGHASVSGSGLSPSRTARVRVRVNDGFNETAAVSPPFTALDAPPQVAILSPAGSAHISGYALVQLVGQAFDSRLHMLGGRSLRWYDDGGFLGTGAALLAGPLPGGVNRITLVARDRAGRRAVATAVVLVDRVSLPFLRLRFRHRIGAKAHRLTIVAVSGLPIGLTIGGHTYGLQPRLPASLTVPVLRGSAPLLVRISVHVDGIGIPFAVRVLR
jgi:hypothetical protein